MPARAHDHHDRFDVLGEVGQAKRSLHVGLGPAQDDDPGVDEDEGEQRPDVDHLHDQPERHERGDQGGEAAEADGQLDWCPETRVDVRPRLRHQAIASHREEDAGLAVQDDEQDTGDRHQSTERGKRSRQPRM
jgi:hypothetical protein